jgi:hypothetical protein
MFGSVFYCLGKKHSTVFISANRLRRWCASKSSPLISLKYARALLSNSTKRSLCSECIAHSAGHNQKVHYSQSVAGPYPNQMNPVHTLRTYFSRTTLILSSQSSPSDLFPWIFRLQFCTHFSPSHDRYTNWPLHLPWPYQSNNIWQK